MVAPYGKLSVYWYALTLIFHCFSGEGDRFCNHLFIAMLLRVLKMTIKTLLVNLRPSKQLLFITLCVCAVILLLIKLQKPLQANFNIKAKEALIKKPVMPVYTITQPFETDLESK